jgi:hypothetical protein
MRQWVWIATLVAAVASAGEAPKETASDRERIAALIAELDSDDFPARDKAAKALFWEGQAALEQLKAAAQAENTEVRFRARELIRKIERFYRGGKTVGGLQLALHCDKTSFVAGDEIMLEAEARNVGSIQREYRPVSVLEYELPETEQVADANARVTVRQIGGEQKRSVDTLKLMQPVRKPITLKAGESAFTEIRFDARAGGNANLGKGDGTRVKFASPVHLPPGEYEAQVIYFATRTLKDFKEDLKSNTVRFTIEKK